jgi:hypothetical protein
MLKFEKSGGQVSCFGHVETLVYGERLHHIVKTPSPKDFA